MRILVQDLRASGSCHKGARQFCQHYGIDWKDFVDKGIDADKLLAMSNNDHQALHVVNHKKRTTGVK
jgi:hypothetical protein